MSPRASDYARRRQRLRRKKLCTRCAEPAKPGSTLCPACLRIMAIKRPHPDPAAARAAEVAWLHERLDLIDEARRAVQAELDRLA